MTAMSFWRRCSSCKGEIGLGAKYYVCSVSSCNTKRTGYVFCGMSCFERHLPGAKHRDAGAIEEKAPSVPDRSQDLSQSLEVRPKRRIVAAGPAAGESRGVAGKEVLVIASRLKDYIQARSSFNTSNNVMEVLSDYIRDLCDEAIEVASKDGRKTVMDRDFKFRKGSW